MALLGVETPVYAGAHRPLIAEPRHAAHVHGKSGLNGAPRFDHKRTVADGHAVDKLIELADADTWVVALGPLTNLAHAMERDPSWPRRIAGISLMGGSTTFGNATRVAEFNVWADAEAAARVFSCGANIIQCGLNLTHPALHGRCHRRAPCANRPRHALHFAADILEALHERLRELVGRNDAPLHDPCAVLALTHPHLIETQPRAVSVENARRTDPRHDRDGRTHVAAARCAERQRRLPHRCGAGDGRGAPNAHGVASTRRRWLGAGVGLRGQPMRRNPEAP